MTASFSLASEMDW